MVKKRKTIKQGIRDYLSKRKTATFRELVNHVKKFYVSRTGWGKRFVANRVNDALWVMRHNNEVVRVRRGVYRLRKR